ncbi:MAG: SMP-30/gluconolactonase/LRE family protein, partial [Deltaproteobacteria bacterium]|nr:SMP-30/gluconolactonase/LRE family protein [Deltaproteobacteria bacterium]
RRVKESGAVCNIAGTCVSDGLVNPKAACERCDIAKSKKAWTAQLDGAACDDGAPCTLGDACAQGSCVAGKARVCDDKIACTKDFCDSKSGACVFEVIVGCGDYCETNAHCDDKNLCTTDTCVNTKCSWQNNAAACDDGDNCTFGDVCSAGKCSAGTSVWVELFAGAGAGSDDGAPDKAKFNNPTGLALLPGGEIVVADRGNHRLRKIGTDGVTTTLSGSVAGYLDGGATSARFNQPSDVDAHSNGDLAIADLSNHRIRLLSGGKVSTLAGSAAGWLDGPAGQARFNNPYGVAWSPGGAVYVADYSNNRIRRIDVAAAQVVTVAGDGGSGWIDGQGTSARLSGPIGIDVAGDGAIFFADYGTSRVRHIAVGGKVTTLAGDGTHGFADGVGNKARFNRPWGVQALPNGGVLVADASNHRLRQVAADGTVSGFAGSGIAGYVNGDGVGARLYNPRGIVAAPSGRIYVADLSNHRIRTAQASASSCTIGGSCWTAGWPAADNGCVVCDASVSKSQFTALKDGAACHDGKLCTAPDACAAGKCAGSNVVCDDKDACTTDACDATTGACSFKKIIGCKGYCETNAHCDDKNPCTTDTCASNLCQNAPNTDICDDGSACTVAERCENGSCTAKTADTIVSTLAGSGAGWVDAKGTLAKFNQPVGLARDATGTIWVADSVNHRIRAMAADGTVSTIAGSGKTGFVDGKGDAAWFYYPTDLDLITGGALVADRYNNRIRKVAADGTVTTLAGASAAGSTDGGAGTALFNQPIGVATLVGIAFVADFGNHRIRRVMPDGTTSTLAGSVAGFVDGKGTAARFQYPIGIAVDGAGVVYVTEWDGHRVRRVAPDGTVTTIAGTTAGYTDGEAAKSRFNRPWGIDVDAAGRLFVADRNNARIRMIAGGLTTTVAGIGGGYVDGSVAVARFNAPQGVLALPNGELAIGDTINHRLRHIRVTASACQIGGACWANGAANPAKPCEVCNGSKTPTQWDASGCSNN